MIIGLTGLKGSGKDTVGAYLVKEHSFERRSFADPLKRSFAALFDIPMWEIENFKNDDTVFVTIGNKNTPYREPDCGHEYLIAECPRCAVVLAQPDHMWSPISEQSFRSALQRYGTESHRYIFGEDFWVDQTLPVDGFYIGHPIVLTDCRFKNEAERITKLGGYIVRVERPGCEADHHSSEIGQLDIVPHYKLVNDNSIELLYNEVEKMLTFFLDDGA